MNERKAIEKSNFSNRNGDIDSTLKGMGRNDLLGIFEGYKPRYRRTPKKAPLDQKVSISINQSEKELFLKELESIKKSGVSVTMSQYIRNKALGTIDIEDWRAKAEKALIDIERIESSKKSISGRRIELIAKLEEEDDESKIEELEKELVSLNKDILKTKSAKLSRSIRLSGRVSFQEFETIKHRAGKLCLNYSDYLRMIIFNLEPGSSGDAHLSYNAKRRFYISVISVSENGWGQPSSLYQCPQCSNYIEHIEELENKNKALVQKVKDLTE